MAAEMDGQGEPPTAPRTVEALGEPRSATIAAIPPLAFKASDDLLLLAREGLQ
jgi:hypothetical protein